MGQSVNNVPAMADIRLGDDDAISMLVMLVGYTRAIPCNAFFHCAPGFPSTQLAGDNRAIGGLRYVA